MIGMHEWGIDDIPEDYGVPFHYIVVARGATDTCGRVLLWMRVLVLKW